MTMAHVAKFEWQTIGAVSNTNTMEMFKDLIIQSILTGRVDLPIITRGKLRSIR